MSEYNFDTTKTTIYDSFHTVICHVFLEHGSLDLQVTFVRTSHNSKVTNQQMTLEKQKVVKKNVQTYPETSPSETSPCFWLRIFRSIQLENSLPILIVSKLVLSSIKFQYEMIATELWPLKYLSSIDDFFFTMISNSFPKKNIENRERVFPKEYCIMFCTNKRFSL